MTNDSYINFQYTANMNQNVLIICILFHFAYKMIAVVMYNSLCGWELISVKKELNRLYILGTLITWFASYLAKSSQILKNHSIMLFTSNANSL